jgi:hypothetical protein
MSSAGGGTQVLICHHRFPVLNVYDDAADDDDVVMMMTPWLGVPGVSGRAVISWEPPNIPSSDVLYPMQHSQQRIAMALRQRCLSVAFGSADILKHFL